MRLDWGIAGTITATWSSPRAVSIPSTSGPIPPRQVVSMRLENWRAPRRMSECVARWTRPKATSGSIGRESVLVMSTSSSPRVSSSRVRWLK